MDPIDLECLGTIRPDGTLELDERLPLPAGRVKVYVEVEPLPPTTNAEEPLGDFVDRLRREAEAAGAKPMNEQEVAAWIQELRADDTRIEEIHKEIERYKKASNSGVDLSR